MTLSQRDEAILTFERSWWTEPGPKELAVAQHFQLTMSEYHEILSGLIEDGDAMELDPLVVRRLRRTRDKRRRERADRHSVGGGES